MGKIEGKNWEKEVKSPSYGREAVRKQFYYERAKLKLTADPNEILKDPEKHRYKTYEDLLLLDPYKTKLPNTAFEKARGYSLFEILQGYFEKLGLKKLQAQKEVYLTLHCLGTQQETDGRHAVNVDSLKPGDTVKIEAGQLYIRDAAGNMRVNGAYLRMPPKGRKVGGSSAAGAAPVAPPSDVPDLGPMPPLVAPTGRSGDDG